MQPISPSCGMYDWKSFFLENAQISFQNNEFPPPLFPVGSWFVSTGSRLSTREAYHTSPYRFLEVCRMHDFYLHVF
jgi:hypothetical protein